VYGVGATDATDRPLAISRRASLPRLVAYGMDVDSGLSFAGSDAPPTFTGTSLATAIASAAAMVVWGQLADSDPHDVMAMVYDSGVDLPGRLGPQMDGRGTEVCLGSASCAQLPVHRVSVCGAVTAALAAAGATGSSSPACTSVAAHSAIDAPPIVLLPPTRRPPLGGVPVVAVAVPGAAASARSCPAASCGPPSAPAAPPIEPWTRPQPERPPCSTCRLTQPNPYGNSYLWGTTESTFTSTRWSPQLVVTPRIDGVAQPDQAINLPNQPGALVLDDWIATTSLNSASARFEWYNPGINLVLVSQSTAINVDTP